MINEQAFWHRSVDVLVSVLGRPLVVWASVTAIVLGGMILSMLGFDGALPRSGCVLVALAILCVYVNHFVQARLSVLEDLLVELNKADGPLHKELGEQSVVGDGEDWARKLSEGIKSQRLDFREKHRELALKMRKILAVEFGAGFGGTLLWGFGDLLPI